MPAVNMGADLDLGAFFLLNMKPEPVATLPGTVTNGRIVFLTSDGRFYFGVEGSWRQMGDRATHTGTQAASTISDLKTTVVAYRLDEFAAPTAPVSMGTQRVSNVANGTAAGDAVNKSQLDAVSAIANAAASGIALKSPVRLATTTNDSLSGLAARDGVTPVAGDRVLVTGQTTASANGIYIAAAGAWARSADADTTGELAPGTLVAVREGTTNADTLWSLVSDAAITVGTTAQTWAKILNGGAAEVITAGNGLQKSDATLSVLLAPSSGMVVDGTGLRVDTAVVSRRSSGLLPAGANPVYTHNLNSEFVIAMFFDVTTGAPILMPYTGKGTPNAITVSPGTAVVAGTIHVVVHS